MPPALTAARFRNRLESSVGEQLSTAGVPYDYEGAWVPFAVPARKAKYLPDFRVGNIIIETKGWFGRNSAKERMKLMLVRMCNPELDVRIVFSDANKLIYKGSPTTYGKWAEDNEFKYSTKGIVPAAWIKDLKEESKRVANGTKRRK
jgi:Phage endonuclease I